MLEEVQVAGNAGNAAVLIDFGVALVEFLDQPLEAPIVGIEHFDHRGEFLDPIGNRRAR